MGKNPTARKEIILGESQRKRNHSGRKPEKKKIKRKKKKNQCQKRNLSGRRPEEKEIKIEMKPQNNDSNLVS